MRESVKAFVAKLGSSLLVIVLLAPILALSMIAGGRLGAVTPGNGNEWLLIALAFGGAAASALNGLGRSIRRSQASGRRIQLDNDRGASAATVHTHMRLSSSR